MLTLLAGLAAPNLSHVVFALLGAAFVYWAKQHPTVIPPELEAVVEALLLKSQAVKAADAHAQLVTLAQPLGLLHSVEAALMGALTPAPSTAGLAPAASKPAGAMTTADVLTK